MGDDRIYWAAWARVPGIGPGRMQRLHRAFGGLDAAWRAPAAALAASGALGRQDAAAIAAARDALDPVALWRADRALGLGFVRRGDPGWPPRLEHLPSPPAVLWVAGAWPLDDRAVAVVGTRRASPYGERHARRLGAELAAAGALVVSGLAMGVDRAAHEGALGVPGGWTVGVAGCGLRHVYPAHHRTLYRAVASHGTLLSEFPPEVRPSAQSFPRRNRIIAALAHAVVVVEAGEPSGSLITADLALGLGREVLAVPGPIGAPGSAGPHRLLREGAPPVEDAGDVFAALGWGATRALPAPASSTAATAVLAALGDEAVSLDRLVGATGLDIGRLGSALVALELEGLVSALPGARWARAR